MTAAPTAGDALALARLAASGAVGALARQAARIDDINVFPVPDGDTGANLLQTARSVLEALESSEQRDPRAIAAAGARAALLGARGNSGIILSQLVRGACGRLGEGGALDGRAVAEALRRASTEADSALREPVEGTILTVARALAEGAEGARSDDPIATLAAGLAAAEAALARTTDMLPSLRAAGVVDAGGAGLVELVRGALAALRGEPVPETEPAHGELLHEPVAVDYAGPRYCTGFLVTGSFPRERLEARLAALGDCVVVVSDGELVRAHVHTDDPGAALSAATALGGLSGVEISDMHVQRDALAERTAGPMAALDDDGRLADVLAIVDGDGNRVLYASLGARLLLAGRPSAAELLSAIRTSPAAGIVVLPNDAELQRVAQDAARAAAVPVHVVPTHGLAQGLAALVAYRTDQSAAVLGGACAAAAAWAGSGEVAGGADDPAALREAVEACLAPGSTLVTVLAGATAEQQALDALTVWLASAHPGVELELHAGGQAQPRYSVSAE